MNSIHELLEVKINTEQNLYLIPQLSPQAFSIPSPIFIPSKQPCFLFHHVEVKRWHFYKFLLVHLPIYSYLSPYILPFLLLLWLSYSQSSSYVLDLRPSLSFSSPLQQYSSLWLQHRLPSLLLFPSCRQACYYFCDLKTKQHSLDFIFPSNH